jgi:hypothetical protein
MLKAAGKDGISWIIGICNAILKEGKITPDSRKSCMVHVYKRKGDALDRGSYRGIKILNQATKVFERVLEERMRKRMLIDNM